MFGIHKEQIQKTEFCFSLIASGSRDSSTSRCLSWLALDVGHKVREIKTETKHDEHRHTGQYELID